MDFFEKIDAYLSAITNMRSRIVLMGDFNLPGVDWNSRIPGSLNRLHADVMLKIMVNHSLVQVVNCPTRIHDNCQSILDLIFLSDKTFTHDVTVEDGISDHKSVVVVLSATNEKLTKARTAYVYDFQRADDTSILDALEVGFDMLPQEKDVNKLWEHFKSLASHCLSRFVPRKVKRIERANPWVTRNIIHLKRRLRRARKKVPKIAATISALGTQIRRELKNARTRFFSSTLTDYMADNPKRCWRYLSSSKPMIHGVLVNETVCSEPVRMAEAFNNYFVTVFSSKKEYLVEEAGVNEERTSDVIISKDGIVALLLNLDVRKSSGPDKIPNAFLKRYCEWVSNFLVEIFTASLEMGALPDNWLVARVVPIFKAGDKLKLSNYRPISITCTVCKLLEHVINKYLVQYAEDNLFYAKQHGFRRRLSTVTQLFETIQYFADTINQKEQVDVIALDFSKAFDKVCHVKLIQKQKTYGINPMVVKWIEAYLCKDGSLWK